MEPSLYIEPDLIVDGDLAEGNRVDPAYLYNQPKSYLIVGRPGTGKTTFLQQQFQQVQASTKGNVRGFFISLREISSPLELSNRCQQEIDNTPESIKLYLYLDGIDEVKDSSAFLSEISRILKRNPNTFAFVTSRMSHSIDAVGAPLFRKVEIAPLSDEKVSSLLKERFSQHFKKIQAGLNKSEILSDLVRNPLMLEIFSRVVEEYDISAEHTNPSALVEIFVNNALSEFNRRKSTEKNLLIDINTLNTLLENLAAYFAETETLYITPSSLFELIDQIQDKQYIFFASNVLLEKLIDLPFIATASNGISFSHMMFYEYFLARGLINSTGKRDFSISLPVESVPIKIYFSRYDSKDKINKYLSEKLKGIQAYDTGTDIIYAKAGSLDLSLAVVLVPGILYCFIKFADSFFKELGKITAKKFTEAENSIDIPLYIENELPEWILNDSELKMQYLRELSKKYAENSDIKKFIAADPKARAKELTELAVCVALSDEKKGVSVSTYR